MVFKVLIVDDEERIRKGLEMIIDWKTLGFNVCCTADNGRNGIAKARELMPDLIIADMRMPGVDGIQMIKQLREEGHLCQFIILSGLKDFQYAKDAIDLKVAAYLLKPVNETELTQKITQLFGNAEMELLDSEMQAAGSLGVMKDILEYIDKNYNQPIKLNSIANDFHYSTPYLGKIFKKTTGETFHDYLEMIRMEKAKLFLSKGNKVYVVAKMVGYTNVDYFADKFKSYVGMTPNDYKRNRITHSLNAESICR